MTKVEYIKKMYSILVMMCVKYGYHNVAAGMVAQSIQEGWNSGLATVYHNYWGMKTSSDFHGKTIAMNNKQKNDPAVYRTYLSMEDGCKGYFEFLSYPRYSSLKYCTSDEEYLDKIGPCGWNGNKGYGSRCKSHLKEVYEALGSAPHALTWVINNTYTTQQDLNVRRDPDGDLLMLDDLTDNAKANAFVSPNGNAVLKRGTRVTVKDICVRGNTTWLKIPSGWICGKNSKNIYVS
ncbi:MAG: glucosaminidase domain-containing protein [Bacteroidales bacterium]|nr:glucosaminidase domain-containing protein [Bacteroidales bacterium]